MRKLLLICLLTLPLAALADDFGYTVPQWKDFAPSSYVDVEAPSKWNKFNTTLNYWYERRVAFENGLNECSELLTNAERVTCYEALKVKQYNENTDYNARIEAKQSSVSAIQEMNTRTDSMLPINNYFNGMTRFQPNEIR